MDKYVENVVDNSEDKCVENIQQLESQIPEWIQTWSDYILKGYPHSEKSHDQALELIQEILMAMLNGDSCIERENKNINVLESHVIADTIAETTVAPFVYDDKYLYLYRYWHLEQSLATQIARLKLQRIPAIDISGFEHLLEDQHQKSAMNMVAKHALNIITGGPGTGKTYTLARIIAVLNQAIPDIRIAMAAPTGKAAQRMKEALQNSFDDPKLNEMGLVSDRLKNQETLTIHRLLGLGHQQKPRFHAKQQLPFDVIVIDEASMLDLNLATLLFNAVPENCRLILLGDAHQLASVDVGSVLADLGEVPALQENRVNLLTSRRFKEGALIGKMAKFIQQSENSLPDTTELLTNFGVQVVVPSDIEPIVIQPEMSDIIQLEYLPETIKISDLPEYYQKLSYGFLNYFDVLQSYLNTEDFTEKHKDVVKAFDQYRILTAIHHGAFGLESLNHEMEKVLFQRLPRLVKQGDWYIGRPVMMSYNDYQLGLSNGDIGICFKHRTQSGQFEVYFPSLDKWVSAARLPKNIQTAFALTIHKSQGSEFSHTAVVLDSAATKLLSQELIYTAITRAKTAVSLLVDVQAFIQSLKIKTVRHSGLKDKIILKINK